MTDAPAPPPPTGGEARTDHAGDRLFLVVVDDTDEWRSALRFACGRAQHTGGRVGLATVIEPSEFEHWMSVGEVMREEMRSEAEGRLQEIGHEVQTLTGRLPVLMIREGTRTEEVLAILREEPAVSILVLGARSGGDPGPLVQYLLRRIGEVKVPVTIVPAHLSEGDLDFLA